MYGQDEWNVRQEDIYQPDLSDKPKKEKEGSFLGNGWKRTFVWTLRRFDDLGRGTVYAADFRSSGSGYTGKSGCNRTAR